MKQTAEMTRHIDIIDQAVARLVIVNRVQSSTFITVPLFYPSGSEVAVRVDPAPSGFRVSDSGFGFREVELLGYTAGYTRRARIYAEENGLVLSDGHDFWIEVAPDQLSVAITVVASASYDVSHATIRAATDKDSSPIVEALSRRLEEIFGIDHVRYNVDVLGATGTKFKVTAQVVEGGKTVLFEAVPHTYPAVASCYMKFHDIGDTYNAPKRVAVVRDRDEMGSWLGLLARSANVVQDNDPESVFRKAA